MSMLSDKERKREKSYVDNSLKQMLAYRKASRFFTKIDVDSSSLLQFAEDNHIDFTDICFGAIKSPDNNDFVGKLNSVTKEILKQMICEMPDGIDKATRKDQLEYLKNIDLKF